MRVPISAGAVLAGLLGYSALIAAGLALPAAIVAGAVALVAALAAAVAGPPGIAASGLVVDIATWNAVVVLMSGSLAAAVGAVHLAAGIGARVRGRVGVPLRLVGAIGGGLLVPVGVGILLGPASTAMMTASIRFQPEPLGAILVIVGVVLVVVGVLGSAWSPIGVLVGGGLGTSLRQLPASQDTVPAAGNAPGDAV